MYTTQIMFYNFSQKVFIYGLFDNRVFLRQLQFGAIGSSVNNLAPNCLQ